MAGADVSHSVAILAVVILNALFLIDLTYRVMTKRVVMTWDTGAMAVIYAVAVVFASLLRGVNGELRAPRDGG